MNESFRSGLLRVTECHANAVADINLLRQRGLNTGGDDVSAPLAQALAKEEVARVALIEWRPSSNVEAQLKFLYMVNYLISAKAALDLREMAEMMDSIAHLLKRRF
jgi:hypothetical protein